MAPQSSRFSKSAAPARRRRLALFIRPLCEQLEDRTAPALFNVQSPLSFTGMNNNGCVAAADLNKDGFEDAILTNYGGSSITILYGKSGGGFNKFQRGTSGTAVSFVAIADINGDTWPDAVVVNGNQGNTGSVSVFKNDGAGNLSLFGSPFSTFGNNSSWVGLRDVTGDGVLDVIVCSFGKDDGSGEDIVGNNAAIFEGNADAQGKGDFTFASSPSTTLAPEIQFIPTALAVADFDGDGLLDIAAAVPGVPPDFNQPQVNGIVYVFSGTGGGGFGQPNLYDTGGALPVNIQAADVNADSRPDLIVANAGDPNASPEFSNDSVGVLLNVSSSGNVNFGVTNSLTTNTHGTFAVAVADFNLDGDADIAAVNYGSISGSSPAAFVSIYTGNGAGTFTPASPGTYTTTPGIGGGQYVAIGDFDANGSPDLIVAHATNLVGLLLNTTVTGPSVTINQGSSQSDPTNSTSIVFDVVFSEDVTGFDVGSDVDLSGSTGGGSLSATVNQIDASNYTVTVTGMTGTGTVKAKIPAGKASSSSGGVANLASTSTDNQVTFDVAAPTVTINQAAGQADPATSGPILFTVIFSENVTGFTASDVDPNGGTLTGLSTEVVQNTPSNYTVKVTGMSGNGTVVAKVLAGAAIDTLGNQSVASTSTDNTVTFNTPGPTVTINQGSGQADPTNSTSIAFDVVFSEGVTGFTGSDVDLSGSSVGGLSASVTPINSSAYTVTVTGMTGTGTVTATIPAGAATSISNSVASLASTSTDNLVSFDVAAPTVTIDQAAGQVDPAKSGPILFTVIFTENVTGFGSGDVDLSSSSLGGLSATVIQNTPSNYTVSVTGMSGNGTVIAKVVAGAAIDGVGNASSASTSTDNTVTFDGVIPSVTINQAAGQADPTSVAPITFTVHFSEVVTGFDESDVSFAGSTVGGTLLANVTGTGADYSVAVTGMSGVGTVVASIPAGAAIDGAGNNSSASTSTDNTVTFDNQSPSVTINQAVGQDDPTSIASIKFDVKFSENVTGFDASDVNTAGSTVGGTLAANVSGSGNTYTVTITGMTTRGFVVATIPAGAAADALGNLSLASTSTDNSVEFLHSGSIGFAQPVFSAAEDDLGNTVTQVAIVVTRSGQSEGAVSIDYVIIDGTAHHGGSPNAGQNDYIPSDTFFSGTLTWADGQIGDKPITIDVLPDKLNEGRELIKLALINPVGGFSLGLAAANVALARSDGQGQGLYADQDGDLVRIKLSGKTGSLLVYRNDPDGDETGPIDSIQLIGTLPDPLKPKATLAITVAKAKFSTDGGTVGLGGIDGDGIKSISARKANLNGDGIILNGYLNALTIGNISGGADITTLATLNIKQTTRINALEIGNGTTITVGAPLANLTAKRIGVGSIVAPSIGTMSVTGQVKPTIIGDMASKITVSGAGLAAGKSALGSLTVAGSIPAGADIVAPSVGKIVVKKDMAADVTISGAGVGQTKKALTTLTVKGSVTGSDIFVTGNVGTVTVGGFHGSRLFAGYAGPDDPDPSGFTIAATVTRFNVNGKTDTFEDSRVIATNFKTVTIKNLDSTNAGSKFGFYADTSLGAISVVNPKFKYNPEINARQGVGDFDVRVVV